MPPVLARTNVVNLSLANAILPSQSALRQFGRCANGQNIGLGQLGAALFGAARLPALGVPIGHVVRLGPEKEMIRIYAQAVIALVTDNTALWDRAAMRLV